MKDFPQTYVKTDITQKLLNFSEYEAFKNKIFGALQKLAYSILCVFYRKN